MVTALYRRYRPETFAEMIGQAQVTEPLMTALRTNRVGQAYLFSGPRGCGKTTSARILARCLNCAKGPTDTPCGVCPSCVELGRGGHGSLDVVEIDAASHNGVDDAREIRERAIFAPSRDRYKIFILDEAHMVTPQGFNALLKIVEEPPEHVVFLFATTEPDKVIGTIRSRTHHYPFRLVPSAPMIEYIGTICADEGVTVAPGVLPLVARAGGGSPRDTLSLLDQLIAGSEGDTVEYERAVALLGYTPAALLDEVVSALARRDAASAFEVVDRVIQTGQDPRRFVEDLLERLRDLIVVTATAAEKAEGVLHGVPRDALERIAQEASRFGPAELSRSADLVHAALTAMTGATAPRMHLELLMARLLIAPAGAAARDVVARLERLERRLDIGGPAAEGRMAPPTASSTPPAPVTGGGGTSARPDADEGAAVTDEDRTHAAGAERGRSAGAGAGAEPGAAAPPRDAPATRDPATVTAQQVRDAWPQVLAVVQEARRSAWIVLQTAQVQELRSGPVLVLSFPSRRDVEALKDAGVAGHGVGDYLKDALDAVLGIRPGLVAKAAAPAASESADTAVVPGTVTRDRQRPSVRTATGGTVADPGATGPGVTGETAAGEAVTSWDVIAIPHPEDSAERAAGPDAGEGESPEDDLVEEEPPEDAAFDETPAKAPVGDRAPGRHGQQEEASAPGAAGASAGTSPAEGALQNGSRAHEAAAAPARGGVAFRRPDERQRYGEAVVREVLGARFLEEQNLDGGD
ncbi:MAG TPA: DNA polymerase III subunit gamma and tau [Microbacteriaceae bacterium]|nr:DNA polymerase III subunit gamma and tau [Microbacteriaceae bacterium]